MLPARLSLHLVVYNNIAPGEGHCAGQTYIIAN